MSKVGIVGGGLLGSSIAYHLTRTLGDAASVVVLDHHPGASCATAQSAGLLIQMSGSAAKCAMAEQTLRDIDELELTASLLQNGTLRLASSAEEKQALDEEKRVLDEACTDGKPLARWVGADEAQALVPWLNVEEYFVGGMFCASDGQVDPQVLAGTYLRAARENGAKVVRKRCSKLELGGGALERVFICMDDDTKMACDHVIVAAGAWSGMVLQGLYSYDGCLPMAATRSHYWLSDRYLGHARVNPFDLIVLYE
jgi:glycine/D-amino acid oxidase-like deaminating enzyme